MFIGPCAKRSSNLIAVQRVSTCDSRYIQTLDRYLDRLSDNDSSGRYGQLLQYVCFPGLCADSLANGHHPQSTLQKKSESGPVWTQSERLQPAHYNPHPPTSPAQPLPFDHINQTHLPVSSYHLESNIKRGREPVTHKVRGIWASEEGEIKAGEWELENRFSHIKSRYD